MNANWNLPILTTDYPVFLTQMKSRDEDAIIWLENSISTFLPNGAKRWSSTGKKFEKWDGSVWSDLSTLYEIKVADSNKLNGQLASYYAVASDTTTAINAKVNITDIVNNLTSTDTTKPLSANQGKVLKGFIDSINTILTSNDTSLDQLQEIVNYIKQNKTVLDTLAISNIAGLVSALAGKLGVNDTAANASKLNGRIWNWSAQGGQPPWLWGGFDGIDMYVYNPANFSVNYANSSNYANSAGSTNSVTYGAAAWGNAQLPTGEIGTYAFLLANGFQVNAGGNYAGSSLRYVALNTSFVNITYNTGMSIYNNGAAPTGTWKCMGHSAFDQDIRGASITLFLRIA